MNAPVVVEQKDNRHAYVLGEFKSARHRSGRASAVYTSGVTQVLWNSHNCFRGFCKENTSSMAWHEIIGYLTIAFGAPVVSCHIFRYFPCLEILVQGSLSQSAHNNSISIISSIITSHHHNIPIIYVINDNSYAACYSILEISKDLLLHTYTVLVNVIYWVGQRNQ